MRNTIAELITKRDELEKVYDELPPLDDDQKMKRVQAVEEACVYTCYVHVAFQLNH